MDIFRTKLVSVTTGIDLSLTQFDPILESEAAYISFSYHRN